MDDQELEMVEYFVGVNLQDAEETQPWKSEDGDILKGGGGFRKRRLTIQSAFDQVWHELKGI
jgi:hypothetical protein